MDELVKFLDDDKTDTHTYINKFYNCVSFTEDLLYNAKRCGIRGYFVVIDEGYLSTTHAIAMFNTTDSGIVYVEPQEDLFIDVDDIIILEQILY